MMEDLGLAENLLQQASSKPIVSPVRMPCSGLKSAGAGLTGSSPVPGTTELSLLVSYLLIRKPRYDVAFVARLP